mgnify:CR=1 FL=1
MSSSCGHFLPSSLDEVGPVVGELQFQHTALSADRQNIGDGAVSLLTRALVGTAIARASPSPCRLIRSDDRSPSELIGAVSCRYPRSFFVRLSGAGWRRRRCCGWDDAGWVWRCAAYRLAVVGLFRGPRRSFVVAVGKGKVYVYGAVGPGAQARSAGGWPGVVGACSAVRCGGRSRRGRSSVAGAPSWVSSAW